MKKLNKEPLAFENSSEVSGMRARSTSSPVARDISRPQGARGTALSAGRKAEQKVFSLALPQCSTRGLQCSRVLVREL